MKIFAKYDSSYNNNQLEITIKPDAGEKEQACWDARGKIKDAIYNAMGSYGHGANALWERWDLPQAGGQALANKLRLVAADRVVTYDALLDAIYDAGLAHKAALRNN